jgi:hypothetical protein
VSVDPGFGVLSFLHSTVHSTRYTALLITEFGSMSTTDEDTDKSEKHVLHVVKEEIASLRTTRQEQ